jgi:hypothetical protein
MESRMLMEMNFRKMEEETGRSIDELMSELQQDISHYKATGGVSEKLRDFLHIHHHGKKQQAEESALAASAQPVVGVPTKGIGPQVDIPLADKLKHNPVGTTTRPVGLGEVDPLEEELNKLAELAGIAAPVREGQLDELSRRDFLKGAGAALGGAALAGVAGGAQAAGMGGTNPTAELGQLPYMMMWVYSIAKYEKANPSGMFNPADIARADKISTNALRNFYAKLYDANPNQRGPWNDMSTEVDLEVRRSYQQIANGGPNSAGEAETLKKYIANADKLAARLNQYAEQTYGNGIHEALAKDEATYGDVEVDDNTNDQDPVNGPDEEYMSMDASTMTPGEDDPGEKNNYDGPGDNKMKQQPRVPAKPVLSLESYLAAEYESIKKKA